MPSQALCDGTLLLLSFEAHAVGTLLDLRISLMSTYKDLIKSTIILSGAVIGALMNGAFDVVVLAAATVVVHDDYLQKILSKLLFLPVLVCSVLQKVFRKNRR